MAVPWQESYGRGPEMMGASLLDRRQVSHIVSARHPPPLAILVPVLCPAQMNMLVTGSWDKTVKYWDLRQANPVHTQQMPEVRRPEMARWVGQAGQCRGLHAVDHLKL